MTAPTPSQEPEHKPVAYDAEGRPLYAHPPAQPAPAQPPQPQVVHMVRAVEPVK